MENLNLMMDLIEKYGEENVIEQMEEKTLSFVLSLQKFKNVNRKEDAKSYNELYNEVCEKLADMKLMMEHSSFLFNQNYIDEHYNNKKNELINSLEMY